MAKTMRKNTDALGRGGSTRTSVEGPVMGVERRGRVIQIEVQHQPVLWEECYDVDQTY